VRLSAESVMKQDSTARSTGAPRRRLGVGGGLVQKQLRPAPMSRKFVCVVVCSCVLRVRAHEPAVFVNGRR